MRLDYIVILFDWADMFFRLDMLFDVIVIVTLYVFLLHGVGGCLSFNGLYWVGNLVYQAKDRRFVFGLLKYYHGSVFLVLETAMDRLELD